MNALISILYGIIFGLLIFWIKRSTYMPKARTIQAIMLFGKLYTFISNVEGKKIDTSNWDLVDLKGEKGRKFNIHFFPWPFFDVYKFPFSYSKEKMLGEEEDGDKIVWKNEDTKHCVVSRSGISDHLEWRAEYPTITPELDTEELASVNTFTNNMIEITNPAKALFGVKNWFEAAKDILHGGLRGLVAKKNIYELNKYSSEDTGKFNEEMLAHANIETPDHPCLPTFGLKLFKSVFKDFAPADAMAKKLMDAHADVTVAEKTGDAEITTAKKHGEAVVVAAAKKAEAYEKEQEAIVKWRKKFLVDTGLAKTNAAGEITELVPDAETKISAEALKALANLKGTLVMDNSLAKMLNINAKKEE